MSSFDKSCRSLSLTETNSSFVLPDRQMIFWSGVPPRVLPSSERANLGPSQSPYVLDAFTVTVPWEFVETKCPVNNQNRDEWTERQRILAENAVVAKSLSHLQDLVRVSIIQHLLILC